ncbi:MAG: MFS transporter [Pirellulales bacterium]|nr:MFS transporter [Pirellulales bacterium]
MSAQEPQPMTFTMWTVCVIAAIGFTFDTYELLMLPLVLRPALVEMGIPPVLEGGVANPAFKTWVSLLFYLPAVLGGVFGLLGGYLTDRVGRRRMLTFSILLYALAAFASGYSTTPGMLLFFRCLTFIGVCLEFVAAIAWLAELFPEPRRRERVLGYTQAFGSAGGFLVALVYGWMVHLEAAGRLPQIVLPQSLNFFGGQVTDHDAAWRYTLMSGLLPALPLIVIRPFLPESPEWKRKKEAGTLKRPSIAAIFSPELRRTTIVTTLMFAFSFGAAFGAIQQMPRMIPGVPQVRAQLTKETSPAERKAVEERTVSSVTKWQEIGGIVGRLLLAALAVRIASRRGLLRVFLIPGLIAMPVTFAYAAVNDLNWLYIGMFVVALTTIAQFSFWGNYLPRVYPIHLRGTGESFAANIGGRMIGTGFAAVTTMLAGMEWIPGSSPTEKLAYTAAGVGTLVFAANLLLSCWLPEPRAEALPD